MNKRILHIIAWVVFILPILMLVVPFAVVALVLACLMWAFEFASTGDYPNWTFFT